MLVLFCLLIFSNSAKLTLQGVKLSLLVKKLKHRSYIACWSKIHAPYLSSLDKMLQLSVSDRVDGIIFAEGVGTINITLSLSGPRTGNTTVKLSITGHQATGWWNA